MKHLPSSTELARLDSLLAALDHTGDSELLHEHLQSARTYLLGAMSLEYSMSLDFARQAAHNVHDDALRHEMDEGIASLIAIQ